MTDELFRQSIQLDKQTMKKITADAKKGHRTIKSQLEYIVEKYYEIQSKSDQALIDFINMKKHENIKNSLNEINKSDSTSKLLKKL